MYGWLFLSGVGAGLLGYTAVVTVAAQRLLQSRRRLPPVTPADAGLLYEDIRLQARGAALSIAAWHIPAAAATRAIIIAHGVGGCRGKEFTVGSLDLVAQLVGSGFTVLMLDLRGHGASDAARMTYGIRERHEVLGAVDWLLAQGYAPGAIGVLGASMGGVAGMGAAGEEPAIGALISDSACADFQAMISLHFRRQSKLPLVFLPGALLIGRLLIGENLARLRPHELLRKLNRLPVLIIHAQGDRLVPVEHAHTLAQAGDAELWVTDSSRHLGSFGADPRAYSQRVIQFFERALFDRSASRGADDHTADLNQDANNAIHTTLIHELLQTDAQTPPGRSQLRMRWYTTPEGLRLRWELLPTSPESDQHQRADDTGDSDTMATSRIEDYVY
ncbi:MAG: alpha/beta fold hydrolase [Roseiflexaceae bacterium]|nr:alpha/beta fold hydrolase [Roseiflexaceae bacterium]